ncbi:MAG: ABC transporter ATP-binding protein [Lachnospira eligens]
MELIWLRNIYGMPYLNAPVVSLTFMGNVLESGVGSIGAIKSLILHASVGQFMIVRYVSELVAELIIIFGYDEGWKIFRKEKVQGMKLEVRNLKKTYGTVQALKGINYTFTPGVYGILGANGAGKSTMINLITDNVSRDKMNGGSILFGEDSAEEDILKLGKQFRGLVGYMPQQQGFYEDFSPKAFLKYMAEIKGVKKNKTTDENGNEVVKTVNQQIDELLEVVNLTKVAYKKIGGFSGGMKQRVLLAQALLGNPKILILDEPTAGLDPKERISIRNYIAELSKDKIILFATHVVSDIECIADKVLLLKSGEIIATGTPVELIESMAGKVGEITCTLDEVGELQKEYKIGNIRQRKNGLALRVVGDELPEEAVKVGDNIDLEDVYLYYFE